MRVTHLVTGVFIIALAATTFAATPLVLNHQGRLLDNADAPVSGTIAIRFSLHDSESSTTELWSEIQSVIVNEGLFSVHLGSVVPLTSDIFSGSGGGSGGGAVWLGITVSGEEMLPRLRVVSVPYAIQSSRVAGDITTTPGGLELRGSDSRADVIGENKKASMSLEVDLDNDGTSEGRMSHTVDGATNTPNCEALMQVDPDDDGIPDAGVKLSANSDLEVRGDLLVGAGTLDVNGKFTRRSELLARAAEASYLTAVSDNSGNNVNWLFGEGTISQATDLVASDLTGDGVPDVALARKTHANGGTFDAYAKGGTHTGRVVVRVVPSDTDPSQSLADIVLSADTDGDAVPESEVSSYARKDGAVVACDYNHKAMSRLSANEDTAKLDIHHDVDGDGTAESSIQAKTHPNGGVFEMTHHIDPVQMASLQCMTGDIASMTTSVDLDNDGFPETSSSSVSHELGHNLGMQHDPVGNGIVTNIDQDCDGVDASITLSSSDASSGTPVIKGNWDASTSLSSVSHSMTWDTDGDGKVNRTANEECDATSARAGVSSYHDGTIVVAGDWTASAGGTGVTQHSSWDIDGNGIKDVQIGEVCDDDGSEYEMSAGVTNPNFIRLRARDIASTGTSDAGIILGQGTTDRFNVTVGPSSSSVLLIPPTTSALIQMDVVDSYSSITMSPPAGSTGIQIVGDGRIGMGGTAHATNPVHHSSGAHLSAAGDWVNASDENAKENYSEVDGAEILRKLEGLNISEWNYKTDDEDIRHIGPTAQDFKKTFGVGDNDKSISP